MSPAVGVPVVEVDEIVAPVEYRAGWARQRAELAAVVAGAPGKLLLLEHQAVYTAGKRTEAHERPTDGTPVVDVDRGGRITWHGPGQLVGYPIVRLPDPLDVVAYVRRLETALIAACAELGLPGAQQVEGRSGVWLPGSTTTGSTTTGSTTTGSTTARGGQPDRKIAAIGIRVERGVTMHGFSINCDCDLSWAAPIVPCGIPDAGVTSLTQELGRRLTVADARPVVRRRIVAELQDLLA